jgi:hypothetical protein
MILILQWFRKGSLGLAKVGLYLHTGGMLAIQSLRLPPPFRGLGSVLPYRSRDVGSTDLTSDLPVHCRNGRPICKSSFRKPRER